MMLFSPLQQRLMIFQTGLSGNMIILSVLYYGGSLVTSDALTVGNLASFVLYAAYVGIGLSGVSTFYAEIMKGLGASSRIFEIIDSAPSVRQDAEKVGLASQHKHFFFAHPQSRH